MKINKNCIGATTKKLKLLLLSFCISLSTTASSSEVEELILLCRGGMEISQIVEISGDIEGRLKKLIKAGVEVEGSYETSGSISQYDLIQSIKEGMSEDLYKFDLKSYHNCIERMGPSILNANAVIAGESIRIDNSGKPELVKIPIKTHLKNDTGMTFQYAKEENGKFAIAFRLLNSEGSSDRTFQLKSGSVRLVGEDSVETFDFLGSEGLSGERSPKVIIPPKGSGMAKFIFKAPGTDEAVTLSSHWTYAGATNSLSLAVTFHVNPLRIVWIDVESRDYKFSGEPTSQAF